MHSRLRGVFLAGAAVVALVPSSGAVALAGHSGPAVSHTAVGQPLSWSVVPSPDRVVNGRTHLNVLFGVSCPSADSCIAVGAAAAGGQKKTLAETWNGTAWSIVPSANRGAIDDLYGVSCLSPTDCTAVGVSWRANHTFNSRTLIEAWNGSTWSLVPSPNPSRGQGYDQLDGVSCVSASFCAAVGVHGTSTPTKPLIETWNGSTWSVVPSPHPGLHSDLSGVSCVSASSCTAVGSFTTKAIASGTLVESWNGTAWSVVPSPDDENVSGLTGVDCVSASTCTAVGGYDAPAGGQNLIESWNGTTWSIVPSPDSSLGQSLNSVSCVSASDCIAAGNYVIQAWDGSAWSLVPTPHLPGHPGVGDLESVSCVSATMCMAAGVRSGGFRAVRSHTLTELGTASG